MTVVRAEVIEPKRFAGRNKAILLGCVDDAGAAVTCVVKLAHRIVGTNTFWTEWVAGLLAQRLGIAVPAMYAVDVDLALAETIGRQLSENATASVGLNFGSEYLGDAIVDVDASSVAIEVHLREQAADVGAFDVFIDNPDRRKDNPNCFVQASQPPRLVAIDHDLAFTGLYLPVLGGAWPLDILAKHVFAGRFGNNTPELDRIRVAFSGLDDAFLDELPRQVPSPWLTGGRATTITTVVAALKKRRDELASWFPRVEEWVRS